MSNAKLGNLAFRLDPTQISYNYQIDYTTIDTIGGQVIQVLGSTTGDITIQMLFGEDHANKKLSWQLAESFHSSIRAMIDAQALPGKLTSNTQPVHNPISFTYATGNGLSWNMKVLIKGVSDLGGTGAIEHSSGKFSYGCTLTLFLVEDSSLMISKVTTDQFISRMAAGLGWSRNDFNGDQTLAQAIKFIQDNSTDGTFQGYLNALLGGTAQSGSPLATGATAGVSNGSGGGLVKAE